MRETRQWYPQWKTCAGDRRESAPGGGELCEGGSVAEKTRNSPESKKVVEDMTKGLYTRKGSALAGVWWGQTNAADSE